MNVKTNNVISTTIFVMTHGSKTWDIRIDQVENSENEEISYTGFCFQGKRTVVKFSYAELKDGKIDQLPFDLNDKNKEIMGKKEFTGFLNAFEKHFKIKN